MSADDHRLIADCLQGDTRAFGALVCRYQDRLYTTIFRLLGNADDAEDVLQDVFVNAYQSLGSFKGEAMLFTWLYRIAMNAAISHKRKRKLAVVRIEVGRNGESPIELEDTSESNRPEHAMEQVEQERSIQSALARLSPEHRAVLVMKDMEGRKYEDMAEVLEVPVGTIRSRLHRARMELRELLDEE